MRIRAMPSRSGSPTVALWQLARELQRLRLAHKMNRTEVAKVLEVNSATVGRWESTERVPREKELKQLARYYQLTAEEMDALVELRRQAGKRGWWQSYDLGQRYGTFIGLEADASEIEIYESSIITGLLQTEDYAREVIRGTAPRGNPTPVEQEVEVRLARQRRFYRESDCQLWVIMGEAALRQLAGDRKVMRDQLSHLLELMEHPRITLQVIPFTAGVHVGMPLPSFMIMRLADYGLTTVYVEGNSSNLFLESETDVARHDALFNQLRLAGVGGDLGRSLIAGIIREL
ncbi:helix-turn-helix domain-containing protein [Marinitenerispora sediminis]|nr:helix-turn-helix transcriptional regulator [Marinitenerispora sediminis]